MRKGLLIFAATWVLAACAKPAEHADAKDMAVDQAAPVSATALTVTSPAFAPSAFIPKAYAALGARRSPPLAWSGVPARSAAAVRSYTLIVQDADSPTPKPFVHWLVFNIPASTTTIHDNALPAGAVQGHNSAASASWFALSPPPGAAHRYHFQVFALDTTLPLKRGASREDVIDAMRGHVLASGEVVGLYKVA